MDNNNKECSLGTHLNENCTAGNRSVLESFEKLDVDLLIARSEFSVLTMVLLFVISMRTPY